MVAPLQLPVPPPGYGGTELVVGLLTDELVRRGHEVTLFASGDSRTEAHLEAVVPRSIRATDEPSDVWEALNLHAAMRRSDRFDLIHIHSMIPALPIAALSPAPLLTTLHSPIEGRWTAVFERYEGW
jgi:glycosyltransferase involved in cell wall biosynthesis